MRYPVELAIWIR